MKLKGSHLAIGAVAVIGGLFAYQHFKGGPSSGVKRMRGGRGPGPWHPFGRGPPPSARAMLGRGLGGKSNPGITNFGQTPSPSGKVGGWTAAGHNAGLDPGPWSYLTAKNENVTLARTPTNRKLHQAGIGNMNATHRLQGAWNLTPYRWDAVTYYW